MRPDAKALLARLGQRDFFQYRQFADPISDVEPWLLFAALLEDERVVGRAERATEERAPAKNFLSDYDNLSVRGEPGQRHGGSLRAFLSGLSDDHRERR